MDERIRITLDGGIAQVRIIRPDKRNALDFDMFAALADAMVQLAEDRTVRCVVLSGEGHCFSAGIDLVALAAPPDMDLMARSHGDANGLQAAAWGWRTLPVPVIAAVHGLAFGAGFQIMLGADLRIATTDCQFSIMEMRWGLVPDLGGMALMRGLVRDDVARELVFSGRRFGGVEAAAMGVVTRLADDPLAAAMAMAREIATSSPDAVRAAKRLLNLPGQAGAREIMLAESAEQITLMQSANHREALIAAREGRTPAFANFAG
jgi:enoyl-CoA hydratase/carnithine racemase